MTNCGKAHVLDFNRGPLQDILHEPLVADLGVEADALHRQLQLALVEPEEEQKGRKGRWLQTKTMGVTGVQFSFNL